MVRRIPPLNPLRIFEAVARTENLSSAARELHVTPSAVSKQLAVLETYLGVELFRRERYGVSLTHAGKLYASQVVPSFDTIANATERLMGSSNDGVLVVRTYTTFAAKWLIPRLRSFRDAHPGFDVQIATGTFDVDFDREIADVAIQFGRGDWSRLNSDLLFLDQIEPVCSPAFFASHAPNSKYPESLLRSCLLVSQYRQGDWEDWLYATALSPAQEGASRMSFATSVLTWQAAIEGLGLAMGQIAFLTSEFSRNALVRPFKRPVQREQGYYLVRPKLQRDSRKVGVFRDWILSECASATEALSG